MNPPGPGRRAPVEGRGPAGAGSAPSPATTRLQLMSDAASHEPGGECRSCPVCLVLQTLDEVRPDVRAHLIAAGRELTLALRAALAPERDGGPRPSDIPTRDPEHATRDTASRQARTGGLRRIDIQ